MRSRNLKPGFFTNEFLVELGPAHAILFAGLWCMADRRGVLEDRPGQIRLAIPLIGALDVDKALNDLQRAPNRFIKRYSAGGRRLIKILNFRRHQNPHVNEKSSDFIDYEAVGCLPDTRTMPIGMIPDSLSSDSLPLDSLPKDVGNAPPKDAGAKVTKKATEKKAPSREHWQHVYAHVFERLRVRKHGARPHITAAENALLGALYDGYGPWTVMAGFDLWMEDGAKWSKWAYQNGHSIKAFYGSFGAILDDARWKSKAAAHEQKSIASALGATPVVDPARAAASLLGGNMRVLSKPNGGVA